MHKTQIKNASAVASGNVAASAVAKLKASGLLSFRAVALFLVLMSSLAFGAGADDMADGVADAIEGMETIIVSIGKALLGIAVIYAIYRGVRRILG